LNEVNASAIEGSVWSASLQRSVSENSIVVSEVQDKL